MDYAYFLFLDIKDWLLHNLIYLGILFFIYGGYKFKNK